MENVADSILLYCQFQAYLSILIDKVKTDWNAEVRTDQSDEVRTDQSDEGRTD